MDDLKLTLMDPPPKVCTHTHTHTHTHSIRVSDRQQLLYRVGGADFKECNKIKELTGSNERPQILDSLCVEREREKGERESV